MFHGSSRFLRYLRIWYWTLRLGVILARDNSQAEKFAEMHAWVRRYFRNLRTELIVTGAPIDPEAKLFVGNHLSMMDALVLWHALPIVFMAHAYVGRVPFIGPGFRRLGFLFVERNANAAGRNAAYEALVEGLRHSLVPVNVFPSGKTGLDNQYPWKWGPLRAAQDAGVRVQPYAIHYESRRDFAFIDDDSMPGSLWRLSNVVGSKITLHWFPSLLVEDAVRQTGEIKALVDARLNGIELI